MNPKVYPKNGFNDVELVCIHETCHHIRVQSMTLKICNFRINVNIFEMIFFKRARHSFMFDFRSKVVPNEGFFYFLYFIN